MKTTPETTDASHSFEAYFKRATSPIAVLYLLRDTPMYGYEISQAIRQRSGGRYTIALLYPVLYRLEDQGYITIDHTEIINNRARSYYAITDAGRKYYERSIREYQEISAAFTTIVKED